jgi:hypothetical protein
LISSKTYLECLSDIQHGELIEKCFNRLNKPDFDSRLTLVVSLKTKWHQDFKFGKSEEDGFENLIYCLSMTVDYKSP